MIKVGVDARAARRAIDSFLSITSPVGVTSEGMKAAKKAVQRGYREKWERLGYGGSLWERLKESEGFSAIPGFFTGTTFRSIDYRLLDYGHGRATGEVSVYGHWPGSGKVPGREKRLERARATGVSLGSGGLNPRAESDWAEYDALNPYGGHDPEELFLSREAEERGEEAPEFYDKGRGKAPSEGEFGGFIQVGPGGVIIQYPGSKAMFKPRELMRTKKYGTDTKPINFISLDPGEVDDVTNSVFKIIRSRLNRVR